MGIHDDWMSWSTPHDKTESSMIKIIDKPAYIIYTILFHVYKYTYIYTYIYGTMMDWKPPYTNDTPK